MKKVLFIDRDGTLIQEPPSDYQIDSLEKLAFVPGVFQYLAAIVKEMDYSLVMVSNQDGLGTDSFPEEDFRIPHEKMLDCFRAEGITFEEILIDTSTADAPSAGRKPNTGMLQAYLYGRYDLAASYVIGDRLSDVELAANMSCKAIALEALHPVEADTSLAAKTQLFAAKNWAEIYRYLKSNNRLVTSQRKTKETDINLQLQLDGTGVAKIDTGLGFFDHMLEQIARHALCDVSIAVTGDLEVDEHHTIEDVGLCLGMAFKKALGSKKGLERYGFCLPMDESLAMVALDFGGRSQLVWEATFHREMIGSVPTEMFEHFFKSFSDAAGCNLFIRVEGKNEHHKIEAIFKAFAKAIKAAVRQDPTNVALPTTKEFFA